MYQLRLLPIPALLLGFFVLSAVPGIATAATGTLEMSSTSYGALQNLGVKITTVNRVGGSSGAASVTCKTVANTAVAGRDFTAVTRTLTWASGDATPKNCDIPIVSQAGFSGQRTFSVEIVSASGAVLGSPAESTVIIYGTGAASVSTPTGPHWGEATLSWVKPTTDTNGAPLTNLSGYKVFYGMKPDDMTRVVQITNAGTLSCVIEGLSAGPWFFTVIAYNAASVDSPPSTMVTKTI